MRVIVSKVRTRLELTSLREPIFLIGTIVLLGLAAACETGVGPESTGELSVLTATNGSEPDSDGYVLTVDGEPQGTISTSGTTLIGDLPEGTHAVLLTDVADNCAVSGDNPRTVSVVAGQTVQTAFSVMCNSTKGSLAVTTTTIGDDPDDAYTLSVDGEAPLTVAGSGTLSLSDLTEGAHTLQLGDVSANCTVAGENPRTVVVVAGETESTAFDVSCVPAVGELSIAVLTSGQDLDSDGYALAVDGGSPQLVGIGDTVVVSGLTIGPHAIELSGVAANCTVNGDNPRSVTIELGVTVTETFDVTCTEMPLPSARIVFASERDGDFEIYSMNADGSDVIQLTDNTGVDQFPAVSADGQFIAFTSNRDGSLDLYTMRLDGSNLVQVTNGGGADRTPAWSPDGTRLAFTRFLGGIGDIYTMRIDGTDLNRLTDTPFQDLEPAWSPDGLKIAYTNDEGGFEDIYTMNASDGSNKTNLTNNQQGLDVDPDWSPDGSLILFHRNDRTTDPTWLGDGEIMCMAADGSGVIRLTTDTSDIIDWKPRWSPDGLWFVFSSNRDEAAPATELYLARTNGCESAPAPASWIRLTEAPGKDEFPDWAP